MAAARHQIEIKLLKARLAYIYRVASGKVTYASDFGRVCTIERVAKSSRLPADLRDVIYGPRYKGSR